MPVISTAEYAKNLRQYLLSIKDEKEREEVLNQWCDMISTYNGYPTEAKK